MSSLSSQLNSIKINQNALKIGPNQEQPTILFDKYTARNTSIDTIYSMSILAYDKISHHLSNSLQQIQNRQQLLGEGYKQINRNTLTKQENNKLSRKLQKFIIELAPFLLSSQCQHIFEYLLRNFKVNVFQAETLTLSLLQYWNFEIYQKIISNINKRQMTGKLTFLNQMTSTEQINFSFIIKTLTFSHAILERLISIILEGSLIQIKTSKDQMISLNSQSMLDEQQIVKHPLKNFLLKIFLHLIKQKRTHHFKYIIEFCSSCLRIKYPSLGKASINNGFQLISMVLVLLINLLFQNGVSDQYLLRTIKKLLTKFVNTEYQNSSQKNVKQIFDFLMIVWQRKTHVIDREIVQTLMDNHMFIKYFNGFNSSKYMIFRHLWMLKCYQGVKCESLLQTVGLSIKNQQFFKLHQLKLMNEIFQIYQKTLLQSSSTKQAKAWMTDYIKNVFKYQFAVWINDNKCYNKDLYQNIVGIVFESSETNAKNQTISVQKIKRQVLDKKPVDAHLSASALRNKMHEQKAQEQVISQQQQVLQQKPQMKTRKLVEFVRGKGIQVIENQLDFSNQSVKACLIQIFNLSYEQKTSQKDRINFHQKIFIIQKYSQDIKYTNTMLQKDLQNEQFAIPIKYLMMKQQKQQNIESDKQNNVAQFSFLDVVFSFILNKKQYLENILFKELFRLVMNKLLLIVKDKYKQTVQFLNKYYKKYISACKNSIDYVQINSLILKISEKVFFQVGNNKGKYQSLIHSHCKLLAILINNMGTHQLNQNSSPIITDEILSKSYRNIIKIFGQKQLYLINIGIIQLITRKELNYRKLKYFIDDVLINQLNQELQTGKQSQISINYYQHSLSIGRQLIFSSYMLGSNDSDWFNSIQPILTSGIAKNQISIFYGLIKDKLKRNIARKMFLFFKLTYQSKKFVAGFKNYLSSIDTIQMGKILHIYSQIYYILLSIQVNDTKIQSVIQNLLDSITNLFPLELRLTLFKPILPNQKLYAYLTSQLQVHTEANFQELASLINIVPNQLSIEWVDFVRQCLKRDHKISNQCIQNVFTNQHFLNCEDNFQIYCELICYLSQYNKDALIPYVNQSMNIILAVCSSDTNPDYCLSIIYRVIIHLKQLVDPFVHDIYKYALENNSEFVQKFIADTVQYLTIPTLIQTVKSLSKTTKHLYNFGVLFKYVCKHQNVGHILSKTLQYYASKAIHSAIEDQVNLQNLYELQADIFLQMALKFNQNQLRKVLIDFVRWSQIKQSQQIGISFNVRKIVLAIIYNKLSSNLGNLFTPFYGYVFDSYLKDFEILSSNKKQKSKDLKRTRSQNNFNDQTTLTYIQKVLQSLTTLLCNDSQKQFIDGTKFDLLSQSLSNLFTIQRFQYKDYILMTNTLSSCLLKLCDYLSDDYQLKSLNLKILLLLRIKNPMMQQAIFNFMDKLIDAIQDRYLLFINDLVPFLIDNIHNRNQKVKIPIKSIINKFEELSGNKIENYIK